MAEEPDKSEKTEEPTQKKLDDALKRGDVAKSQEVNTWFVMMGVTLVILLFSDGMVRSLTQPLAVVVEQAHAIPVDRAGLAGVFADIGAKLVIAIAGPLLFVAVLAIIGNLVQHRLVFSVDPVKPKLSKISPISGAKRLFSKDSLVNFAKGLAKIGIVASVLTALLWPRRDRLDTLVTLDLAALLPLLRGELVLLFATVLGILTVVAALDYAYQRHRWFERQRMTVKELKDEYKQMEGDPMVKAKIRQIRIERGRRRMMANVPNASVIVTNPTHFAVALKYDKGMNAPVCVAKGVDAVALKIREVGAAHSVPIVENPPLARALHASVEVDQEIRPDHYKAVAEVIGYVMRLREKAKWRS